jgi:putative endonuclease
MSIDTFQVGQWGEGVAAEYLKKIGYSILTRNYHTPQGEIDIVAKQIDTKWPRLVFVEVKTRTNSRHGYPETAMSRKKWQHMQAAIQYFLESHPDLELEWCIDVIAVIGHPDQGNPQIQHFESVVIVDE